MGEPIDFVFLHLLQESCCKLLQDVLLASGNRADDGALALFTVIPATGVAAIVYIVIGDIALIVLNNVVAIFLTEIMILVSIFLADYGLRCYR